MFYQHKWIKIKETYAPPANPMWQSASPEMWERITHGVTTILWECSICNKNKREEMLGRGV